MTSEPRSFTQEGVLEAMNSLAVQRIPVNPDIQAACEAGFAALAEKHHLAGHVVLNPNPYLIVSVSETRQKRDFDGSLRILAWGWPGKFGSTLTLTMMVSQGRPGLLLNSCSIGYEGLEPVGQGDLFDECEATEAAYAGADCAEVA